MLENKLIRDGFLEEISKSGYSKLLDKEIPNEFFEEFQTEIGFNPILLFPINSHINCYGILYERLKLYDKKNWQYDFVLAFNEYEAGGMTDIKSPHLKNSIDKIPENKFQNIIYRKLFLDLIFTYYN
ncbi:hypothetical protein [Mangrovivirga cuniculi]|uniref:hypothetical protein n=1 Tax=Mangrovivirga cuniculi TaxID=2715131 RepID=UPI0010BE768A|nr:hypothetical protein [Mangrovivirga cuniculi]